VSLNVQEISLKNKSCLCAYHRHMRGWRCCSTCF